MSHAGSRDGLRIVVLQDDALDGPGRYEVVVRRHRLRRMKLHFDYGDETEEEVVDVDPGVGEERFYFEHRFPPIGETVQEGDRSLVKWNWAQLAWVDDLGIQAQTAITYHTSLASIEEAAGGS